jgi:hypothetical protein
MNTFLNKNGNGPFSWKNTPHGEDSFITPRSIGQEYTGIYIYLKTQSSFHQRSESGA